MVASVPYVGLKLAARPEDGEPWALAIAAAITLWLLVTFGRKLAAGRQWARWLYAVGMVTGTLEGLLVAAGVLPAPPNFWVFSWIGWLFALAGYATAALLFTPEASVWFAAQGRATRPRVIAAQVSESN